VPADGVCLPHGGLESACSRYQYFIADGVTERVVDPLEVVEIDKEYCDTGLVTFGDSDRVFKSILHQLSIGSAGEYITLAHAG
jgi:hypothetical protein